MNNSLIASMASKCLGKNDLQSLFSAGLFLWLSTQVVKETMLVAQLPKDSDFIFLINVVRLLGLLLIALFEVSVIKRTRVKSLAKLAFFIIVATASMLHTNETILLEFILIVFVSRNVSFNRIALTSMSAISIILIIVSLAATVKLIPDSIVNREQGSSLILQRSSLGFEWPSRLPNYYLCVCMFYVMLRGRHASRSTLLCLGLIAIAIFLITGSRNPLIFTELLLVSAFFLSARTIPRRFRCLIAVAAFLAIWCFCLSILILTWFYDPTNSWYVEVNKLVVGRLDYGSTAMHYNGMTLFGTPDRNGSGATTAIMGFADSSYVRLFSWYGIIPCLIFVSLLSALAFKCSINGNVSLLICVMLAGMHGILEAQLFMLPHSPIMYCFTEVLSLKVLLQETRAYHFRKPVYVSAHALHDL